MKINKRKGDLVIAIVKLITIFYHSTLLHPGCCPVTTNECT